MFVKDIFYTIQVKLPKNITINQFKEFIDTDEVIRQLKQNDKLFLYLSDNISNKNMLSIYNSVPQIPTDKIIGNIVSIRTSSNSIEVDVFLYPNTMYRPMVNYLLSNLEINNINAYIVPSLIYDSSEHKIKSIYQFTLKIEEQLLPIELV